MKWHEKREQIQARFDALSQEDLDKLLTDLNTAIGSYIAKGGISQDSTNNPDYQKIIELTQKAETIKDKYYKMNEELLKFVEKESKSVDLEGLLHENGELQKQIHRLSKIQAEIKVDAESAVARDELLRSRNTDVTSHQLYLLDRPVRPHMIPYLWVISILFIGVGLVIFKMMFPLDVTLFPEGITTIFYMVVEFFSHRMVLISLLIAALITILFLSLKIAGVIGN
jgi:hypothetical protein